LLLLHVCLRLASAVDQHAPSVTFAGAGPDFAYFLLTWTSVLSSMPNRTSSLELKYPINKRLLHSVELYVTDMKKKQV